MDQYKVTPDMLHLTKYEVYGKLPDLFIPC